MPNMFKCTLASGGGDGADLVVTCSPHFAGSIITCTDGSSYTKTQTCPSSTPYEVTFESIPTGTYTISGAASGQTFSTTKTILDFDAELNDIPDGATVTPTDNIQIWLHCANIWNKTYTTISQVLNDATTVTTLIASNNAADYMARSTTWASSVCANSSAMTKIGANNYCANKLLANTTWLNAICNSTYFESVLNVKVPTMTSATAPSGVVSQSSGTSYPGWKVFDGIETNVSYWVSGKTTFPQWVQYQFTSAMKINKMRALFNSYNRSCSYTLSGSNDGSTFTDIISGTVTGTSDTNVVINNSTKYKYYRFSITSQTRTQGDATIGQIYTLQFYGRA